MNAAPSPTNMEVQTANSSVGFGNSGRNHKGEWPILKQKKQNKKESEPV